MTTPDLPLISIIVPVHNSASTLQPCLESLARQTDPHYEVIVVDDCSTDGSPGIAERICKREGFHFLALPSNKGQAVARNAGATEACGEALAFVDSDVAVPEDWLENYRTMLENDRETDVFCSGYTVEGQDPEPALFAAHEAFFRRQNLPSLRLETTTSANCVIRRAAFEEVGGYPEYYVNNFKDKGPQKAVAVNEDSELGFLISRKGRRILWTHDNLVRHYFRDTWAGYLKQQLGAARFGALSIFRFPGMLFTKDLYAGEKMVPQVLVMGAMLLSFPFVFTGPAGIGVWVMIQLSGMAFFALYHRRFFRQLGNRMVNCSFTRLFFWLIVTRAVWVMGVFLGLGDGLFMLFSRMATGRTERRSGAR